MKKLSFLPVFALISVGANASSSVYENNVGAININMLTEQMMSVTHNDESISDFIIGQQTYGTMTRVDEYGDDGTTIKSRTDFEHPLEQVAWVDVKYLNAETDYGNKKSTRSRTHMETLGFNTKDFDLDYGALSFGAFIGNIGSDMLNLYSNGFVFGAFSHYKYHNFDITALLDNGSINKNDDYTTFNNAWFNAAIDTSLNIRLNNILYIRPKMYVGYTTISGDKFRINGQVVPAKDFRYFNFVPSLELSTRLARNFYGSLFGKYVSVNGDVDKNVYLNHAIVDKTSAKDYSEFGINLEYNYKSYVFTGYIHKQIEGFDGWAGNLGLKMSF